MGYGQARVVEPKNNTTQDKVRNATEQAVRDAQNAGMSKIDVLRARDAAKANVLSNALSIVSSGGNNAEKVRQELESGGSGGLLHDAKQLGLIDANGNITSKVAEMNRNTLTFQYANPQNEQIILIKPNTENENKSFQLKNFRDGFQQNAKNTFQMTKDNIKDQGLSRGLLQTYLDASANNEKIKQEIFREPINIGGYGIDIGNNSIQYNVNENKHFYDPVNINREEREIITPLKAIDNSVERYVESDGLWEGTKEVVSGAKKDFDSNFDVFNRLYYTQSKTTGKGELILNQIQAPSIVKSNLDYYTQKIAYENKENNEFANKVYENMYEKEINRQQKEKEKESFLNQHKYLKMADDFYNSANDYAEQNTVSIVRDIGIALIPGGAAVKGAKVATKLPAIIKYGGAALGLGATAYAIDKESGGNESIVDYYLGGAEKINENYASNAGKAFVKNVPGMIGSYIGGRNASDLNNFVVDMYTTGKVAMNPDYGLPSIDASKHKYDLKVTRPAYSSKQSQKFLDSYAEGGQHREIAGLSRNANMFDVYTDLKVTSPLYDSKESQRIFEGYSDY